MRAIPPNALQQAAAGRRGCMAASVAQKGDSHALESCFPGLGGLSHSD